MRQAAARGRVRFDPGLLGETLDTLDEAVVRPASGVAYVTEATPPAVDDGVQRLVERIARSLDPQGVLAG
jgi:hypothetical protein